MARRTLQLEYQELPLAGLSRERQVACKAARAAVALAYAPYSRFRVGCAAEVAGAPELVPAANLENAAYPQCICAEAGLLAQVRARFPEQDIVRIAIAVEGEGASEEGAGPCGSCRQQLFEAEARQGGRAIELLLVGGNDVVRVIASASDLLPLGFHF